MNGVRNPFKREGVPRKDLALAALGVDVEGDKGLERERKGAKGLDEIGLSEAELREVRRAENGRWSPEDIVEWGRKIVHRVQRNKTVEQWVNDNFVFLEDGMIIYNLEVLNITNSKDITELPPNLCVDRLIAERTGLKEIPPGIEAELLDVSHTNVREIPAGMKVEKLDVSYTSIQDVPRDCGLIKTIVVDPSQENVILQAASRNGMTIEYAEPI